jgi:hypothetical protein
MSTRLFWAACILVGCGGSVTTQQTGGNEPGPNGEPNPPEGSNPPPGTPPSDPNTVNPGSTLHFDVSELSAQRYPSTCGVQNPPFTKDDLFSLNAVGPKTPPTPWPMMAFTLHPNVVVGQAYSLTLAPWQPLTTPVVQDAGGVTIVNENEESGTVPDHSVEFAFGRGSNQSMLDPNAFDHATVTVLAFPTKDGDPLTLRLQLHFTDGQTLDQTFSGPLVSTYGGCGAG